MITETSLPPAEAPSRSAILRATGVALVVALLILFAVVLPAEYGIDPLRTGTLLGLTGISKAPNTKAADTTAGGRATPVQTGIYTAQPGTYKVDSEDLKLFPGDGVEIKYHMQKGAGMVYAWKANGKVQFEFHGEPDKKPNKDYFESYELDDKVGRDSSYGSFTAPTTGIHGWFLVNKGRKDVDIHLSTAGFYDSAKMYAGGPGEELTIEDPK
ncbi:MAG: transmembrane anchor protein [Acidobacteriota bacterium]|nr:transmembrane anchor protein [Acidobacteriota bacterium]